MSSPLRIGAEAQAEILDAARWYDDARAGLGEAFLQELDRTFEAVVEDPALGSPVPRVSASEVRRRFVRRFPYHVVYVGLEDRVQVLAVAHDRRRPRYWVGRLPS